MRLKVLLLQAGFVVAVLLLWHTACRLAWVDTDFLPAPAQVATTMLALVADRDFLANAADTALRVIAAFLLGAPSGILAGMLLAESPRLGRAASAAFNLVLAVPQSIFLPIFILVLGLGFTEKLVFGFTHVFFVVAVSTTAAVREVPQAFVTAARSFGAGRRRILRDIYLPGMAPQLVTGLRLGLIFDIIGILLAEMYGAKSGLGVLIEHWGAEYQAQQLLAGTLLISCATIVVNEAMRIWEIRVGQWRLTQ
jgi:ABC-type nitrate/sulfonate/bicarbonate transport system permease component